MQAANAIAYALMIQIALPPLFRCMSAAMTSVVVNRQAMPRLLTASVMVRIA